jgi:hypothetical protein
VNTAQAPAVEGDFCSANPRYSVLAGPGAFVAGPSGVTIGHFAWATNPDDGDGAPAIVNNSGSGSVTGFVHREQQGLNTTYLSESGMTVPQGFALTLMSGGDFWVANNGTTLAQPGMKAYAKNVDGGVVFAATGGTPVTATSTVFTIAAATASVTGSIDDAVLTVTAVSSGILVPGETISGTDSNSVAIATGTAIVSQITPLLAGETLQGIGRYVVSIAGQSVGSCTVSGTYGLLTLGGTIVGSFGVGNVLSGTAITTGNHITGLGTGTGKAGTYYVSVGDTASSGTVTGSQAVETKWYARSTGSAGDLVKISDQPLG